MNFRLRSSAVLAFTAAAIFFPASISSLRAVDETKPVLEKSDSADRSLREQEIYIPYEKLRKVFEKEGRGVFLPYEKFQELWKAAHASAHPANEPHPPVGAVITEIESEATVAKDVVQVAATLKIDLLQEGWQQVPLRLGDAALVRATIGGKPARILELAGGEHELLVEHTGKKAEQIELHLEYARSITRTPGLNTVSFEAPQAPVSRWKVRIPQSGVKVTMRPLLAATEVPPEKSDKAEKKVDETVLLAFVGAAPSVAIEWTPKAEGALGLTALATAEIDEAVTLTESVVRVRAAARYAISRAELSQLSLEVPADYKVTSVVDANVRQWTVEAAADKKLQRVLVQLFEPAKQSQGFSLEMEKNGAFKRQEAVAIPAIKALNVGRQSGTVYVLVDEGLRAEATRTSGLVQESLANASAGFRYRYASVPYDLEFTVDTVQPRITVESLVEATLEPERLSIDTTLHYNIERAGVFKLELSVPPGFDVRRVVGVNRAGHAAVDVDSYHVEGPNKDRLVVNLARKAIGPVALAVGLQRDLPGSQLLKPSDQATAIPLPWTEVAPGAAQSYSGRVIIYAPESLRVDPTKSEGLRTISYEEAVKDFPPDMQSASAALRGRRPVLAFAFTQEAAHLQLAALRRKPQVTIQQLIVARVDEGVIKYTDTLFYKVLYSGVKSLRVDIPTEIRGSLHVTTPGFRDDTLEKQPPGMAKDYVACNLVGGNELSGDGRIDLVWEQKIDKLAVGKDVTLNVPRLVPRDVDRAWGQIALIKAETLDFREAENVSGLRPIDPQRDLVPPVAGAVRAFEFQGDWSLPVTVTRYGLEEVKRTSIDRAVVRAVITQAGQVTVQALYRVRSVLPLLSLDLPAGAKLDSDPIHINGVGQTPRKGDQDKILIPLLGTAADEPFVLEVRYTLADDKSLALPQFPENTAVQKVYLSAVTPASDDMLGSKGDWSPEFTWSEQNGRWMPAEPGHDARGLLDWVCEGTPPARTAASSFQADGTAYVFSALRPTADHPLQLVRIDHTHFNLMLFIAIALFGLGLLFFGWMHRLVATAALVIAIVLLAVFLPTFAVHLGNEDLVMAVICVYLLWAVVAMVRARTTISLAAQAASMRLKAMATPPAPVAATKPSEPAPLVPPPPEPPPAAPSAEGGEHHG